MTLGSLWHICVEQSPLKSENPIPGEERLEKSEEPPCGRRKEFISKPCVGLC